MWWMDLQPYPGPYEDNNLWHTTSPSGITVHVDPGPSSMIAPGTLMARRSDGKAVPWNTSMPRESMIGFLYEPVTPKTLMSGDTIRIATDGIILSVT